jgi:hypothetical protein
MALEKLTLEKSKGRTLIAEPMVVRASSEQKQYLDREEEDAARLQAIIDNAPEGATAYLPGQTFVYQSRLDMGTGSDLVTLHLCTPVNYY